MVITCTAVVAASGCGSSGEEGGASTGGLAASTGGQVSSGGQLSTGGELSTGGQFSTGGAPGIGGVAPLGSLGGLPAVGGENTGGALPNAGGTDDSGGRGDNSGGSPPVGDITNLAVEANPNSVLSAYVSWTTTDASSSIVQFGEGALKWEIKGEGGVTEHRVLVIGMHADTTYMIRAASEGASSSVAGEASFTTGALPAQIPVGTISVHDKTKTQPGWTLMNVQKGDGTATAMSSGHPAAVIYDETGLPVWYYLNETGSGPERGGAISVDPTARGVLMGPSNTTAPIEVDWAGEVIWTCPDVRCGGADALSHHAGLLSNDNYVVMRDVQNGGSISQMFEEFSSDNQLVHSVGILDAIATPTGTGDWAHGNAVTIDLDNDFAYMSFRWLGVIKMQYSTRTMLWHLPASYGAMAMGDMTFDPPESQFSDIHDPEIHDDGTILFFDNGGWSGTIPVPEGNPGGYQTRAVEYQIDEQQKTATLVWEFPGTFNVDPWYTQELYVPFWGDADRLDNGNVMITAGRRSNQQATPESRIIEVTKAEGEVVWELVLPRDHGVYRAERIYPLPLLSEITQ